MADDNAGLVLGCDWCGSDTAGCPLGKGGDETAAGLLAEADNGTPEPGLMVAEPPCPTTADCCGRWLRGRAVGSDLGKVVFILSAVPTGAGGDAGRALECFGLIAWLVDGRLASDAD